MYSNIKRVLSACLLSLFFFLYALQPAFSVERNKILFFNDVDGLPRNIVTCIEQDKYGYTWIGTGNGISRYNGDEFKNYEALNGHTIRGLAINGENELWVASENGLYRLDRKTDQLELMYKGYVHSINSFQNRIYFSTLGRIFKYEKPQPVEIIRGNDLFGFYVNAKGIWYCDSNEGVLFKPNNSDKDTSELVLKGKFFSLVKEIDGHLFLGCTNGKLVVLENGETKTDVDIVNHHSIQEIIKVDNEYWLATDGNGIIILDDKFNYKRSLTASHSSNLRINSNSIYDVFEGRNREVWVATYGAGLGCLMFDDSPFKNITHENGNPNSLIAREGVSAFVKDNKIYLGTNYGMSVLNEKTGRFTNIPMRVLKKQMQGTKVTAITTDNSNNFWLGTYDGLLGKYSPDFKFIRCYTPSGDASTAMQRIMLITPVGNNNLLMVTNYRNRNLLNFNLKNEKFEVITLDDRGQKRSNLNIVSIRKNRKGETIALLRTFGLFNVNIEKNSLENNLPEINKRLTFRLLDFYQDQKGYYWLATQKEGLVRMSEDGREFDKWTTQNGFPTNSLLRIESVNDKFLWISTIAGLCRFDMENKSVLVYGHGHGLPGNEFTHRASFKTKDGRLIFGSNAGFTIVDPSKVKPEETKTEVIISDITFQNQSIKSITDKPILKIPLEETKHIDLPFRRNSFTIHFFSIDKDLPKFNNFAYRLLGLENEWIYLGNNKQTTYTNLSPGNYTFEVKSSNKSNVWTNEATKLEIHITPPWYLSAYAFVGYLVFLVLLLFTFHRVYTNRLHLKKEVEMSEYKVQQEHELTEKKLAFFTNISHDLKTPLTLIDAPVQELLETDQLSGDQKNKLLTIKRNSQRLYKLISDILDFRKLSQKQLPLKVSRTKIDEVIENIYQAFRVECSKKQIDFEVNNSVHEHVFIEVKKVEKIIWNLLSNAIKFTPNEGEIYLSVEKEIIDKKPYLEIVIKDSGIGIAKEELPRIFNRFYQNKKKRVEEGTGIGLSIVNDLVELHHGKIKVESTPDVGSCFTVSIPVEKSEYVENEMATLAEKGKEEKANIQQISDADLIEESSQNNQYNLPSVLLVEDNIELRAYLADYFKKKYKVYEANDGVEGLEMVNQKKPDVIITDILMPNMNGYDFCRAIRSNFDTSHLPILMLTANGMVEQQIEGLSVGADAYVTKPFNINYLNTLVHTILENRRKIRNRIIGAGENGKELNKLTEKDAEFVEKLRQCIQKNIANQDLSVTLLSEHFSISRTQLNRKIKSLTGQTPNNLIKSVRLRKAYELIREKGLRVSEAAYTTGFSDPNYFTICFKKEFGENPSQIS